MRDSIKLFNMSNLPFFSETKPFLSRETPARMFSAVKSESQMAWIVIGYDVFWYVLFSTTFEYQSKCS